MGIVNFVKAKKPKSDFFATNTQGASADRKVKVANKAYWDAKKVKKSVFGMAKFPIKKSVPFGTRPFGKRANPAVAVKQARAKSPRYGIAKSQTCGSCKGKGCFTCKGSGKMTGNATAQNMGGGRTTLTGTRFVGNDKTRSPAGHTRVAKSCSDCGLRPALDEKMPVCDRCFAKSENVKKARDYDECRTCHKKSPTTEERYSLGIYAGHMCNKCWDKSGYRKEGKEGFDPDYAGEHYDEDDFDRSMTFVKVSGKAEMFLKSDYPCTACKGFSGNALQLLQHKKKAHPLGTRIEAQQSIKKSIEFKLLDENDPEYHGHTGGGAGYNGTKWVHMHPAQASFDSAAGELAPVHAKTPHRHFKMGAWTTHHSPSGYRDDILGGVHENEMDATCKLPNCGHPQSQHLPGDDGRPACVGCNSKRPRRNVHHEFKSPLGRHAGSFQDQTKYGR